MVNTDDINERIIIALFLGMEGGTKRHLWEAYNLYVAYNGSYEIEGVVQLEGKQAVLDFFCPDPDADDGVVKIVAALHDIAVDGNQVTVQRTDRYYGKDGAEMFALDVTGHFEMASGKVRRWKDVCDPAPLRELYADRLAGNKKGGAAALP